MATFSPPYHFIEARQPVGNTAPAKAIGRFYRLGATGISVWVLNDGTVTTNENYKFLHRDRIRFEYLGGHIYTISNVEAAVLVGAGYTVTGITVDQLGYGVGPYGFYPWGA